MAVASLYENEGEERQHLSAIRMLSFDFGIPEKIIVSLYEHELRILKRHARINIFLSIFVSRRIKDLLTNINSWPKDDMNLDSK